MTPSSMPPRDQFRNADLMIQYFQTVLIKHGFLENARRLDGCEVTGPDLARVAIEIVNGMKLHSTREILESRELVLERLRSALRKVSAAA